MTSVEVNVADVPREDLPELLGRLAELTARVQLRLVEMPEPTATAPVRLLDADQAAQIAGTSRRWLLAHTRGLRFRQDLSRKQSRFEQAGLRRWLEGRRK